MKYRTIQAAFIAIVLTLVGLPLLTVAMMQPTVINVPAGGDVQAAINNAVSLINNGSADTVTIVLEENKDYVCNCVLPEKLAPMITIQSSGADRIIGRAGPSQSHLLARIRSTHSSIATFATQPRAQFYKLRGLDIAPQPDGVSNGIVLFGSGGQEQNTVDKQAHHLFLEKSWLHCGTLQQCQRGLALNSGTTTVIDSTISDIHMQGVQTQAIGGWNGTGPYNIINNLLSCSGMSLQFGGSDPAIPGLVTENVVFERNHAFKPLSWNPNDPSFVPIPAPPDAPWLNHWSVVNGFELKNARHVKINGNIIENTWTDVQVGFGILLKTANQNGGCTWCVTEDIDVTNNIIKNTEGGINLVARDFNPADPPGAPVLNNVRIRNNLWLDLTGIWYQNGGAQAISLEHNTHLQKGRFNTATLHGTPSPGSFMRDNLGMYTGYGIIGDGAGMGTPALEKFGYAYLGNVLAGPRTTPDGPFNWPSVYPTGNFYPENLDGQFIDPANGNYGLVANSPYKGKGTDGTDPGVDMDDLLAAQNNPTPTPSPSPSPTSTPTPSPSPTVTPTPTPIPTPTPSPSPSPSPTPKPSPAPVVIPPQNSQTCTIGKWCYWSWPNDQTKRLNALNNGVAFGCDPHTLKVEGNWLYCQRIR